MTDGFIDVDIKTYTKEEVEALKRIEKAKIRKVAFVAKSLIVVEISRVCEWIQMNLRIPAADGLYNIIEYMNAQQRRKERRKKDSNRKYSIGDKVRIHHRHKDHFNTMTTQEIISYGWSEKDKAMLYRLDQSLGEDFQEGDLVEDIKVERRKI